jgi:fatty-acid desaturase
MIQWGEGLHNNHHAHPQLYDFAVKSNEFDFTALIIKHYIAVDGAQTRQGQLKIDQ